MTTTKHKQKQTHTHTKSGKHNKIRLAERKSGLKPRIEKLIDHLTFNTQTTKQSKIWKSVTISCQSDEMYFINVVLLYFNELKLSISWKLSKSCNSKQKCSKAFTKQNISFFYFLFGFNVFI